MSRRFYRNVSSRKVRAEERVMSEKNTDKENVDSAAEKMTFSNACVSATNADSKIAERAKSDEHTS